MPKKKMLKIILPAGTLILAFALFAGLTALRPEQEKQEPRRILPRVDYVVVHAQPTKLILRSQGTVEAQTKTSLTARVSGVIVAKSPVWREGAAVNEGDILLEIDPVPYRAAVADARSALATARLALAQEVANSAQAVADWETLGKGAPATDLTLRRPQLEKAQADVEAAEARLAQAEQNLSFTQVRAPYDGRLIRTLADTGQAVTAQASLLAEIYSTTALEVALPIDMEQLSLLNSNGLDAPVSLHARFGNEVKQWTGTIERLGSIVDPSSRLSTAVAVVKGGDESGAPLLPGMFVEAHIEAGSLNSAFSLPRAALQPDGSVLRMDEENTLHRIYPQVVWRNSEEVIIESGLKPGDRLCVTPLLFFVEGMEVEPAAERHQHNTEGTQP